MRLIFLLPLLAFVGSASAQGFAGSDHVTCWSWNGGNHSSGSFIQCDTTKVVKPAPKPVAALPPPVVASPVMMPMSAPVTCVPPKPAVVHKKRHFKPKPTCK